MGGGVDCRAARQHSDLSNLSPDTDHRSVSPAFRAVVFTLLAVDGVICAVIAAMLVQVRIGPVPFPISALIAGLVNYVLVRVGLEWTSSPRLAAISLWTWLLTVAALTLGGPGGDQVFGGPDFGQVSVFVLLVLGAAPPGILLWRRRWEV